jgi:hypothetical protein
MSSSWRRRSRRAQAAHASHSCALADAVVAAALQKDDSSHLHQFIIHAALDMVEERAWDTASMYLKARAALVRSHRFRAGAAARACTARQRRRLTAARMRRCRTVVQVVDKFNDLLVSCYNTAGHARLLLLHDSRLSEESIRAFFQEVHELYVKARAARRSLRCRGRAARAAALDADAARLFRRRSCSTPSTRPPRPSPRRDSMRSCALERRNTCRRGRRSAAGSLVRRYKRTLAGRRAQERRRAVARTHVRVMHARLARYVLCLSKRQAHAHVRAPTQQRHPRSC